MAIDRGNSRIKAGLFSHDTLVENYRFEIEADFLSFCEGKTVEHIVIGAAAPISTLPAGLKVRGKQLQVTAQTPLPIRIDYATAHTLGPDRIAAACGAAACKPKQTCLVIDIGTCITFNLLTAQAVYLGGGISPGVQMRYRAMNEFTARLPLLEPEWPAHAIANDTAGCMHSGVMYGITDEVEGAIARYAGMFPNIETILCGGGSPLFKDRLCSRVTWEPHLVLAGLNQILLHNINL